MNARLRYKWVFACIAGCLIGCAPNSNGVMQPTLPWSRQAPPNSTAGANPWGAPNGTGASPAQRWSYLNELMNRADQQESLAQRQRKELLELQAWQQSQLASDRSKIQEQGDAQRAALAKQYADKERLLAEKEERFRSQFERYRGKADDMDVNNRDLHAQLARSEQQRNLLSDEIDLLKRRLAETTQELTRTKTVSQETGRRLQALQASATRQRGNASINANSSISRPITAVMVPGLVIKQDGDRVRISIPTEKLFMAGTANLHQGSQAYMDQVANIIQKHYPRQIVGVEAHTDQAAVSQARSQWRSRHQLTAAQSMAIFEQLTSRQVSEQQLFVMGYGGNHPLASEGTAEGQTVNRRVELVIYPETYGR